MPLVVAALAGQQEGVGAAPHQVQAKLLHGLAQRAGHRLGTDVRDEGAGER
ncbi:histidine phosphotransferase family protein, partial [Mycobacterium avium]|uniref:histidine phosphotransferase family protein n=1 Tax=Mycobacterium avium TaxID=1764 RepID=UPI003AFB42D9